MQEWLCVKMIKKLMQQWLGNNDILMNSTQNKGKSLNVKKFIKTLKSEICKK